MIKIFFIFFIALSLFTLSTCYIDDNNIIKSKIIHVPEDVKTIQEAIDIANNLDTILVENGLYIENLKFNNLKINIYVTSKYYLTLDSLDILNTIIKGNSSPNRFHKEKSQNSVIRIENCQDSIITLDGFTIINGLPYFEGDSYGPRHSKGGGFYIKSSISILRNLIIEKNNMFFPNNTGTGGGIYCDSSTVDATNLIIRDNLCGGSGGGGGIFASSSKIILNNVWVYNNLTSTSTWCGGLNFDNVDITIYNSRIDKNGFSNIYQPSNLFNNCKGNIENSFMYDQPVFKNCNIEIRNCIIGNN